MESVRKETKNDKDQFSWSIETCSGLKFAFFTMCFLAYIAFGGLLFLCLEGSDEDSLFHKLKVARENVMAKFPNVSGAALDAFVSEMSSAGITGLRMVDPTEPKWTYSQSVFFCVTLLTTIGYGHVAPVSDAGKAVCMVYTAFGIPFTLVLLAGYLERLMRVARALQKVVSSCLQGYLTLFFAKLLFLSFTTIIICTTFFLLPAFFFSQLEDNWTYLDGLYFCFISLTTVGLGDFVPGKHTNIKHRGLYRIGVTIYLLLGFVSVMFLMALVAEFRRSAERKRNKLQREPILTKLPSYGSITQEKTKLLFPSSQFEMNYGGA